MTNVIDEKLRILGMAGEKLIAKHLPNKSFVAYQVIKYLWHPFSWLVLPILIPMRWWSKRNFHYLLTNKRLIVSNGIFGVNTQSLPLEKISDVELQNSLLMRTLGTSCLVVKDLSGSGGCFIASIDNAQEFQIAILEAAEKTRIDRTEPN